MGQKRDMQITRTNKHHKMYDVKTKLTKAFTIVIGFAIVPMMVIAFFGTIQTIPKNETGKGFLVTHNKEGKLILQLKGEMEFYWNQLLSPSDFQGNDSNPKSSTIIFPDTWNGKIIDDQKLPGKGYATYRTTLQFDTLMPMAIRIFDYFNAYKLWVNGELISEAGKPGKTEAETSAERINKIGIFMPIKGENELVMQTANFQEKFGGFRQSFLIGTVNAIKHVDLKRQVIDAFVLGLILLAFLYNIGIYVFNTKRKSYFYFALLILIIFIRQLLLSNISLFDLLLQHYSIIYLKATYITAWLTLMILFLFFKTIYPTLISQKILNFLQIWVGMVLVFTIVSPLYYVSTGTHLLQITLFLALVYLIFLLVKSFLKAENQYPLTGLGMLLFIFSITVEALIFNRIIYSSYTLQYGLIYFILFESFVLGIDYSVTYKRNLTLVETLNVQNKNLQKIVKQRTKEALDAKEREILATTLLKSKTYKFLQQLYNKLSNYKIDHRDEHKDFNQILNAIRIEINQKDNQMLHFKKVHPNFFKGLQIMHPSLSQNDLKLCAYIKLNLNNNEIADFLHVQPESVRKAKQRMCKKIGLKNEKELIVLLNNIMN